MTIESQLKQEILTKYKSVRAFTTTNNIPYSTLDSVFKRGIQNAGVSTMIKVFNALDLDIESIQEGQLRHRKKEENSPSTDEAAPGEKLDQEIIHLVRDLLPEQKDFLLAALQLTVARNQGLLVADLSSVDVTTPKAEIHNPTQ